MEDFYPIEIFNKLISKPCGKYYVEENGSIQTFSILIPTAKIRTNQKITPLLDILSIFTDTFLIPSTKLFDQTKIDYITGKMNPIKKELFELVLIRYYQILTFEFSRYFTNLSCFMSFAQLHNLNEKILIGTKYFRSSCEVSIFSAEDFSFDCECTHHSLLHMSLISNILHNVNQNNGMEFPD